MSCLPIHYGNNEAGGKWISTYRTHQSSTATVTTTPIMRDLADDFLYGFDVDDEDDRTYLAEVIIHRRGPEADIRDFVHLALGRGVEEWELAMCRAMALQQKRQREGELEMRGCDDDDDELAGRDLLSFLVGMYGDCDDQNDGGVDGVASRSDSGGMSASVRPARTLQLREICRSSTRGCESSDIIGGKSRKFKRKRARTRTKTRTRNRARARAGEDSPYWDDAPTLASRREEDPTRNVSEINGATGSGSNKKRKRGFNFATPPSSQESTTATKCFFEDGTSRKDEEEASVAGTSSSGGRNNFPERRRVTSWLIQENPGQLNKGSNAEYHTSGDCLELDAEVRDIDTLEPSFETVEDDEMNNTKPNKVPSGETPSQPSSPSPSPSPSPFSSLSLLLPSPSPSPSPKKLPPKRTSKSPYFTTPLPSAPKSSKRPPRNTIPSLPFPPLSSPTFGLIQEELASNPFHLLIAVTLLIRTSGRVAIPVFRTLIQKYPTAFALADDAHTAAIEELLRPLGLGAVRTKMVQKYARMWTREPPRWGRRFVVRGYGGHSGDEGEGDEEEEKGKKKSKKPSSAWEIGHMTQGPYALDSWRIFCRDRLRGASPPSNHPDTDPSAPRGTKKRFQPEWMRVRPRDKELRAYLRWMWMREGWRWDPNTGAKAVLDEELRVAVEEGRVGYDDRGDLRILEGG